PTWSDQGATAWLRIIIARTGEKEKPQLSWWPRWLFRALHGIDHQSALGVYSLPSFNSGKIDVSRTEAYRKRQKARRQILTLLLTQKQERTYRLALLELRRVVEQVSGSCDVGAVMTDFENALRNAITSVFLVQPQNLRECLFHASKAWFNKLRAEGLAAAYRERVSEGEVHSPLNRWLHAIFGLPCLHSPEVTRVWNDLKLGQPLDQRAPAHVTRVLSNISIGISCNQHLLGHLSSGLRRHRTNHAAKCLHSISKRLIGRRRPNIRFFLHKLKVHHEAVRVRLRSTSIPSSRRSPKELQWCLITDRYLAGDMTQLLESSGRINNFPNLSADGDMGDDAQ
ncbi:hypothetical protein FOL47_008815, partial [Perkinsus chesapeaki]